MSLGWLDLGSGWLFEHIRDAVVVVDTLRGTIRLWNPAAAGLFNVHDEDGVGASIEVVLPELLSSTAWAELLDGTSAPWPFEIEGRQRRGGSLPLEVTLRPIETSSGHRGEFAMLVVRDLRSERRLIAAEDRLQRALSTQRFLDEATTELALSLDYDTTLNTIARLALPRLAQVCVVYSLDEELAVEAVAATHLDPEHAKLGAALQAQVGRHWSAASLFEGPMLLDSFEQPEWTSAERDLFDSVDLDAALIVPLRAHGHVLGVMLLGGSSGTHWPAGDVAAAADLARRCALALDNARLVSRGSARNRRARSVSVDRLARAARAPGAPQEPRRGAAYGPPERPARQ